MKIYIRIISKRNYNTKKIEDTFDLFKMREYTIVTYLRCKLSLHITLLFHDCITQSWFWSSWLKESNLETRFHGWNILPYLGNTIGRNFFLINSLKQRNKIPSYHVLRNVIREIGVSCHRFFINDFKKKVDVWFWNIGSTN